MLKVNIISPLKYNTEILKEAVANALPISAYEIRDVQIVKRSLDLSDGSSPFYKMTVAFSANEEKEEGLKKIRNKVSEYIYPDYKTKKWCADFQPIVIGAGPSGLFAALILAESGAKPIIVERGDRVEDRQRKVQEFNLTGILDTESNVQFGEGGAGTFSDGKLKVGGIDKYKMKVLSEFIASGATEDIAYSDTAHLGTDRLPMIVKKIREKIISLGGEFRFRTRAVDLGIKSGEVEFVVCQTGGESIEIPTKAVILAAGHSATDVYYMLRDKNIPMTAKGFGVGVRIEHPREYINSIVYKDAVDLIEDTASYHLVTHLDSGRSVYSFCMCPGGSVVAASSDKEGVVTNGMSRIDRMADNSNAALLVSVTPDDFFGRDALSGIEFQRQIEHKAYLLAGGSYSAPKQSLVSFLSHGKKEAEQTVVPSYPRGTLGVELDRILPGYITESLRLAISDFDSWLPGFSYDGAVLTAPETRTTAPVRVLRTERFEAIGVFGLYPSGEGAGYSGGIVSSATDGIRCAEAVIEKYYQ